MNGIDYIRGGRCPVHNLIKVPQGFPKCQDHPIWLGVFEGSWYEIGKQYGSSQGVRSYIAAVFDHMFVLASKAHDFEGIKSILHSMEKNLNLYEPGFVEALHGEADGAADALAESKQGKGLTAYEKVLLINFLSYFAIFASRPLHECSSITFMPPATVEGKVMVGRDTQLGFGIGNYGVAYAAVPPAPGHRFMVNTFAGVLVRLGIASDAPLYVGSNAGVGPIRPGIDKSFLLAKAAIFGNSVEEAVDLIAHGSEAYRKATGRKTTYRAYPNLYTIADETSVCVLETLVDRWAVRHPGDFGEKDFIVVANHQLCEYSYDENDVRTDIPMYDESVCGQFGGCRKEMDPKLKDKVFAGYDTKDLVIPSPSDCLLGSCTRYWALYWSAMYNHGNIDMKMLQGPHFLGSRFWYDINGKKVEYQLDPKTGSWVSVYYLYPHSTVEGTDGGYPEQYDNVLPGSLAYVPADRTAYWELYKPSMWEGEWERLTFK